MDKRFINEYERRLFMYWLIDRDLSISKFARKIGYSKQAMSMVLLGTMPLSDNLYKAIKKGGYDMNSKEELCLVCGTALRKTTDTPRIQKSYDIIMQDLDLAEIIKVCFSMNNCDELIPNSKWFTDKKAQRRLKQYLNEKGTSNRTN